MPKVTMEYDSAVFPFTKEQKLFIGEKVQGLVAKLCSTDGITLDPQRDIDFMPIPYPEGSIMSSPLGFEIKTIGLPERKAKMNKEAMMQLRYALRDVVVGSYDAKTDVPSEVYELWPLSELEPPTSPYLMVWAIFADPEGPHV